MAKLDLKIFPYAHEKIPKRDDDKGSFLPDDEIPKGLSYLQGLLQLFKMNRELGSSIYPLTLISSVSGKIKKVAFHYSKINNEVNNTPIPSKMIGNLMKEMSGVDFYIIVNRLRGSDYPEDSVRKYLLGKIEEGCKPKKKKNTLHFVEIESDEEFSIWANDTYKSAYSHSSLKDYLIEPHLLMDRTNKTDSNIFFEYIMQENKAFIKGFTLGSVGLSFAGGNMLVGDDFILMGRNIESFNSRRGVKEKKLKGIIALLIEYIAKEKINLLNVTSNAIPFLEKNKNFQEKLELKIKDLNEKEAPFSESWKELLKDSSSFKEAIKAILEQKFAVKKLLTQLLGGGLKKGEDRKIYFVGEKIKDHNTHFLLNEEHHSAIRKDLQGVDRKQPFYHLDLFISLAGGSHLIIGEPVIGLSDEVLGYLDKETLGMISHQVYRMKHYINQVVKQLESRFTISRIPLPLAYYNYLDGDNNLKFAWFWASYNNCLVEIDDENKTVWIPSFMDNDYCTTREVKFPEKWEKAWNNYYQSPKENTNWKTPIPHQENKTKTTPKYADWADLKPYQEQVRKVWSNLGFEVKFIQGDFNWYSQYLGSLKCFTNCIKRAKR